MSGARIVGSMGALVVVALISTSCSSGSAASSSSASASSSGSASGSASSSASPSPSGSGQLSAAAQQFLSLTATADVDLQGFLAQPKTAPVPQIQAAAGKIAADETTLLSALKQATWPSQVQTSIAALESTLPPEQSAYQQCAAAPTTAAIEAILTQNQAAIASRIAASDHLRAALGLPNPTTSGSASGGAASPTGSASA